MASLAIAESAARVRAKADQQKQNISLALAEFAAWVWAKADQQLGLNGFLSLG